jgi:hypothetical protein
MGRVTIFSPNYQLRKQFETFDEAWKLVRRLAALPEFEYEHFRRTAADILDWRLSQLDRAVSRLRAEKSPTAPLDTPSRSANGTDDFHDGPR